MQKSGCRTKFIKKINPKLHEFRIYGKILLCTLKKLTQELYYKSKVLSIKTSF